MVLLQLFVTRNTVASAVLFRSLHTATAMSSSSSKLIRLDDIGETRDWNYERPTLVKEGRFISKQPQPTKSSTFSHKFYGNYPLLKKLNMENLIFKGGSMLDLLTGHPAKNLDLFLVGLDSEQHALERAKQLLNDFLRIEKEHIMKKREKTAEFYEEHHFLRESEDEKIKAVRHGQVITLSQSSLPVPIQITLLRYPNVEQCLQDDELGATAIAFDGSQVWLNEKSKFALENLAIVVEPKMLTARLDKRIFEQYFDKGFDIVLPELDIAALPRHYQTVPELCDAALLPGLEFAYKAIHGNKIFVERFIKSPEEAQKEEEKKKAEEKAKKSSDWRSRMMEEEDDDEAENEDGKDEKMSRESVLTENISKLCNGQDDFGLFAEGDFLLNVLRVWPGIHSRQLNNFYQRFRKELVHGQDFNFVVAKQHFGGMHSVAEIANKLFTAPEDGGMDKALEALTLEHIKRAEEKLQEWLKKGRQDKLISVPYKDVNQQESQQVLPPRVYKRNQEFYGQYFKASAGEQGKTDK